MRISGPHFIYSNIHFLSSKLNTVIRIENSTQNNYTSTQPFLESLERVKNLSS